MAEENQTGADGQQEPEQRTPAPKDVNNAKLRTFTQEEVDRIINERLGRERGRKSDYEELKEKAGQTADLESKLSKALEENEKLKNEAKQAEHEKELSTIRANVAAKHGITDPKKVITTPLTVGYFDGKDGLKQEDRLLKVVSYLDVGDGNYWAHPIENLVAVVDLEQKKIQKIEEGAVIRKKTLAKRVDGEWADV